MSSPIPAKAEKPIQSAAADAAAGTATGTSIPKEKLTIKEETQRHLSQGKKLRKIAKPKKSMLKPLWLAGHVMTLFFGVLYALFYVQRKSQGRLVPWCCYKLTLAGIWLSYAISIQSQFNIKSLPHYTSLIATENFQFLLLSIFWAFNRSSLFKILPFLIISLLQLATAFKLDAVLKCERILCGVLLYNSMFLLLLLLVDTLLLRGTSGYGLMVYVLFMWLRILQSENTRFFIYSQLVKFDTSITKVKNKHVQEAWTSVKKFLTYKQANFEQKYL